MKHKIKTIISAAAVSALAFTAAAQEVPGAKADVTNPEFQRMFDARVKLMQETARVSDVLGMPVENDRHEKLGKVDTLYVNLKSGRIVQVIISTGGFGGTLTAVPPGALHTDNGDKVLHLNASQELFAAAPRFDAAPCDEVTESNRVSAVYAYYNQQTYFVADPEGVWTTNADGTINTDGARDLNKSHDADIDRHVGENSNTISTRNPNGTQNRNYYSNENEAIASFSSLGNVRNVRKLLGMTVRNLQHEKLGKVDNFIVDLSAGRVAATFIVTGEFLGMGGEMSAVPSTSLRYDPAHDDLQLDATPEQLYLSSDFNINGWPNFVLPGYVNGTYYPYKIEPYNNSSAPNVAEASGKETRADDSGSLPALHQGNSQGDADVTAEIRRQITADPAMSENAKNIIIITANGHVTLRGPVDNGEEKRLIGLIAERIAPGGSADNELQVQLTSAITPITTSSSSR